MMNYKLEIARFALVLTMTTAAFAQPPKPPAEAFEACASSSDGQRCQVVTNHGELSGTCRLPPQQDQLVCVPTGHKAGDNRDQKNDTASAAN